MGGTAAPASQRVAPFLRWAGGKRWLLSRLPELLGDFQVKNYHEPFLGGGSVFLGLNPSGTAYLSDLNAELIHTYEQVKAHPQRVANLLDKHENRLDHYYAVRDDSPTDDCERAARFIYLNHTSFNGIYRVNLQGGYNVPFGNRESPNVPTAEDLRAVATRLKSAELAVGDFADYIDLVGTGDLVFLDPPYTVSHNNNGFIKYNQRLFSFDDQKRLKALIEKVRRAGAFYILTNAAHHSIAELFDSKDQRLEMSRRNSVGGKSALRGSATEYLFTNLPPRV